MNYSLTHARHDPAHCLTPGLFRSLKRGERKKIKLDILYQFGQVSLRFWGPEPLDVTDLRVLQGLIAMASVAGNDGRGIMLFPDTKSQSGTNLRVLMDLKWDAMGKDAMVVKSSFRKLAKEIGYSNDGGSTIKTLRASIERLFAVSVIAERKNKKMGYRLLSGYASDEDSGKLFVALNPRLAGAIIGDQPHTRIEMEEVRGLKSDTARLIHQRLCGWIDPGKKGKVCLGSLCDYIWPEPVINPKSSTTRERRSTTKKALSELLAVGWTVTEYAKGKYEIKRPTPPS